MLRLPEFRYHRPASLAEAVGLLDELGESAMAVAGGTDVVPNMKHRLFEPEHLVSLRGLEELRGVSATEREIVIGAGETLAGIAAHPIVRKQLPSLAAAAGQVAGPQLRNAGTLGGNLCLDTRCTYYNQSFFWRQALGFCLKKEGDTCHVTRVGRKCVAAHSADTPPVLMTLDASLDLVSTAGERTVPVREFFVADGIRNTVRRPDEVVVRVRVPVRARRRAGFLKLRQRASIDFPLLNVAAAADLEPDERIASLSLAVSALGSRPRMVSGLDDVATGRRLDADVVEAVAERAHQQCRPLTNIIVDPEWRRAMVPVQVRRVLMAMGGGASAGAGAGGVRGGSG